MNKEAFAAWYNMRKSAIYERISAHDVLRLHGVKLQHHGERREQISCPFHGRDTDPSARVFPSTTRGPSAVWCFVCHQQWDCIKLWQKFRGLEGVHRVLLDMEKHLGITAPPIPEGAINYDPEGGNSSKKEFDSLLKMCEQRLSSEKKSFELVGYLLLGSVLDKVLYQVTEGSLSYPEGIDVLRKVMVKIGQRVRSVETSQNQN